MPYSSSTRRWALCGLAWAACNDPTQREEPAARAPAAAPDGVSVSASLGAPRVLINEILPGNDSIATDEALGFDDWAELYNPGPAAVSLDGWGLANDADDPDWFFPTGTVIDPGGHLVVWLDDAPDQGPLHATFRIDADGDELVLFDATGQPVDSFTWLAQPDDVVLGRFPSGGVFRTTSIRATPGNTNPVDPGLSRDPSDALFPEDAVLRLDLWVDEEAWQTLDDDNYARVPAALAFEGAFFDDVQLRIKGGAGSRRDLSQKAALKVDLDALVPRRRLRGLETLTLNNMVQDVSAVHELLGYQLLRDAGVPAPRVAHVALYVNGRYRGLYLHVESPDDTFLARWFADPEGNLYEGAYGQDVTRAHAQALPRDEQGANDVTDRSELLDLAHFLEQPPSEARMTEFASRIDLDRTLGTFAGEVLLSHWDGYFYYPNNWRIYHDPTLDQWTVLAWGLDQTFGWSDTLYAANGVIAKWCLQVPSCRWRYDLALWDMAERMLDLDCRARVDAALDRVTALYQQDPLREGDVPSMIAAAEATVAYCESRPQEVLGQLFPAGVP